MKNAFPLDEFILLVESKIPPGIKLVDYISDCISLGKDACYRRLRGEVEFSTNEIFQIAHSLFISIDMLMGINSESRTLVEANFFQGKKILDEYNDLLSARIKYFEEISHLGNTKIYFVCNTLPMIIMGKYKLINKLRFYKWNHNSLSNPITFSDFKVPQKTTELTCRLFELLTNYDAEFVLDKKLFSGVIDHMNFFYSLGQITLDEMNAIREELLEFVVTMENSANTGRNHKGKSLRIYSSHLDIETSSVLVENTHQSRLMYNIYSINTLISTDAKLMETHKYWVAYIKKSCSLISSIGDLERVKFFCGLRESLKAVAQ